MESRQKVLTEQSKELEARFSYGMETAELRIGGQSVIAARRKVCCV